MASGYAPFVEVRGHRFYRGNSPYNFMGANFWSAMNMASTGPGGDRARFVRELEHLSRLGVTNLRILAASEGPNDQPWRIAPALQTAPLDFDATVLDGLDYALACIRRFGMTAVLCLNNFWFWSGGMAQYLRWNKEGPIPYPHLPESSWDGFQRYTAHFYSNLGAQSDYEDFVEFLVHRKNTYTHLLYSEDPTILAWELANEPRAMTHRLAMNAWIDKTARFIKSLDNNHLVTTGVEGETGHPRLFGLDLAENHSSPAIDYITAHLWAENWGWYDPNRPETFARALKRAHSYLRSHISKAKKIGKPIVLEEFGMARDHRSFSPDSPTTCRDRFFASLFDVFKQNIQAAGPLAGVNFWAWSGEGRPKTPYGGNWHAGSPWLGDPPHEPQGWYSVYDQDRSTLELINNFNLFITP